jgi:hypothetical protein
VEDFIKVNQSNYYQALATGEDSGDCTGFIVLILELIRDSLDNLIAIAQPVTLTHTERLNIAAQSIGAGSFSRKDYLSVFRTISTGAVNSFEAIPKNQPIIARSVTCLRKSS